MATDLPPNANGQIPPADRVPRPVKRLAWHDEECEVALVELTLGEDPHGEDTSDHGAQDERKGNFTVGRRLDNDKINGTKLLWAAGFKSRTQISKKLSRVKGRQAVKQGQRIFMGSWIPLPSALKIADEYGVTDSIYPLFVGNIKHVLPSLNGEHTKGELLACPYVAVNPV